MQILEKNSDADSELNEISNYKIYFDNSHFI